jgi:hypothetical protein
MALASTIPFSGTPPASASAPAELRLIAFQTAGILGAFALPTVAALLVDGRQLNDASVWLKPLKFELSLLVHMLTLGLLAALLTPTVAASWRLRFLYQASAFAAVTELSYIVLQAARGRASHFNFATAAEEIMYGVMGAGAVLLVACAILLGATILKGARPGTGPGLRLGAGWGLILGGIGTLITAGVMSSGVIDGPGHWVGGIRSDAHGFPLTGWSTAGGDLRVPHFFATHMMQALPLLGLVADLWTPRRANLVVWLGVALMGAVIVLTFLEASSGLPLLRP